MAIHSQFGKTAGRVFRFDEIAEADFSQIEQLEATVTMRNGHVFEVRDIDALELAYAIKPTVVEGRRLRYARHAWMVHNLIGHPLMQLLALFRLYRWAFLVHDATAPRARGAKSASSGA